VRPSTQIEYAVALYRDRYPGLSVADFTRVLEAEHGIAIPRPKLYVALRKDGLVTARPVKAWRLGAAPIQQRPDEAQAGSSNEAPAIRPPAPMDPAQQLGRDLQALTDQVDRLNALARDRIVDWRRGFGTLDSARSAVAALKEFVIKSSK
jgi:hypothetical protein